MRVLLVDDNREINEVMSFYFQTKGNIEYKILDNGKEALNLIKNERFDLILLDLAMPEFSGPDILKELDEQDLLRSKNIVIYSASSFNAERQKELVSLGTKGFLRKPPSLDDLNQTIDRFRP
jgi:two-component system OmpR family response regulator